MLDPAPAWTYSGKQPLTQWYGHVHLLPDHAVGQWSCVERATGRLLWQSHIRRANTFCGVDSGVIVASEMRSDGPWTCSFGCYGIALDSGALLWVSHGDGIRGRLARMLDFVPGLTNELRDAPHHVENGEVFCESGRILDVRSGRVLKHVARDAVPSHESASSVGQEFYNTGMREAPPRFAIGNGLFLRRSQATTPEGQRGVLQIAAEDEGGASLWQFSTVRLGRYIDGNFYSYRLVPPFLYLVVSDEPRYKPHPRGGRLVVPNRTRWHLVTLDLLTGEIRQDFSLGDEQHDECRIEDVDHRGLLISRSNRELLYFVRTT